MKDIVLSKYTLLTNTYKKFYFYYLVFIISSTSEMSRIGE